MDDITKPKHKRAPNRPSPCPHGIKVGSCQSCRYETTRAWRDKNSVSVSSIGPEAYAKALADVRAKKAASVPEPAWARIMRTGR